jgi:hypothetical protein
MPIFAAGIFTFKVDEEGNNSPASCCWHYFIKIVVCLCVAILLRHLCELVGEGIDHKLQAIGDAEF